MGIFRFSPSKMLGSGIWQSNLSPSNLYPLWALAPLVYYCFLIFTILIQPVGKLGSKLFGGFRWTSMKNTLLIPSSWYKRINKTICVYEQDHRWSFISHCFKRKSWKRITPYLLYHYITQNWLATNHMDSWKKTDFFKVFCILQSQTDLPN